MKKLLILCAAIPSLAAASQTEPAFKTLLSTFTAPAFKNGRPILEEQHTYFIDHFGNKTFNLCVLNALAPAMKKEILWDKNIDVLVPPLSLSAIKKFQNS